MYGHADVYYTCRMVRAPIILAVAVLTLMALPQSAFAATTGPVLAPVPISEPISQLYSYSLKLVGLAVFIMFVIAGLTYIVPGMRASVGDPVAIIKDAVIGLVILLSAYLILNTINPELVGNSSGSTGNRATVK